MRQAVIVVPPTYFQGYALSLPPLGGNKKHKTYNPLKDEVVPKMLYIGLDRL